MRNQKVEKEKNNHGNDQKFKEIEEKSMRLYVINKYIMKIPVDMIYGHHQK